MNPNSVERKFCSNLILYLHLLLRAVALANLSVFATTAVSAADAVTQNQSKDFRAATEAKRPPKAAVDSAAGLVLAFAEVLGTPDQAFRALTTNEAEKWWRLLAYII